jgi:hypothetical protein
VAATKEDGKRGALIANYVRPSADGTSLLSPSDDSNDILQSLPSEKGENAPYDFVHCGVPDRQFKVWEAARATTAIPGLFEHFTHASQQIYLGGPGFCTDTARVALREAHRLWPAMGQQRPDLLLSIGARRSEDPAQLDVPPGDFYFRIDTGPPNSSLHHDEMTAFSLADVEMAVEAYLQNFTTASHTLAYRLVSTSFYFEPSQKPYEDETDRVNVQGMKSYKRELEIKMAILIY